MRTKFYDDMLWSVFPPASSWNYTFQSFPEGNLTSRNLCQTLTHIYTQWLPTFLHFPDSQTWSSWYSKEFIYMAMNSIPHGRSTFLHSFSLLIYTFLSFGTCVFESVSVVAFTPLSALPESLCHKFSIQFANCSIVLLIFHLGLILFCISDCFTFPFLDFFPPM